MPANFDCFIYILNWAAKLHIYKERGERGERREKEFFLHSLLRSYSSLLSPLSSLLFSVYSPLLRFS
jgi:hypothetical protein